MKAVARKKKVVKEETGDAVLEKAGGNTNADVKPKTRKRREKQRRIL